MKREQLKFVISLGRIVVCRSAFVGSLGTSPLEWGIKEGENPVSDPVMFYHNVMHFQRVGLFGNAALSRWYIPSKAKYWRETDSKQVP